MKKWKGFGKKNSGSSGSFDSHLLLADIIHVENKVSEGWTFVALLRGKNLNCETTANFFEIGSGPHEEVSD